jgi:colanic acid/amylovoran biosynthesis glycosyltransferase
MRIYAFVESYPNSYKPYYDTQFADLLRAGHDLTVFAVVRGEPPYAEKVVASRLVERTRLYLPAELRSLPAFTPALVGGLLRPGGVGSLRRALPDGLTWAARVREGGRILTLPTAPPELCFVHGIGPMTQLSWLRQLYPGVPVAMYFHGGKPEEAGSMSAAAERRALGGADVIFTNTEFSRGEAVRRGADPERTVVLPVGFDPRDYEPPSPRAYRPGGVLRLASVGRLSEGKGHRVALEAVRSLVASGEHRLRYTLIGDGPTRPALERSIREHGLASHVQLRGTLPNEAVIRSLGEVDALVLPSFATADWAETQATVVQEALLMGVPVVTTTTGGVPESIPEEMRRFSAAPDDARDLAAAIARLARLDDAELERLGGAGREWVLENYDIRKLNSRMLQEIERRVPVPGSHPSARDRRAPMNPRNVPA